MLTYFNVNGHFISFDLFPTEWASGASSDSFEAFGAYGVLVGADNEGKALGLVVLVLTDIACQLCHVIFFNEKNLIQALFQ